MEPKDLQITPRWRKGSHSENGVSYGSIEKDYDTIYGQKLEKQRFFKKNQKFHRKTS